MNISIKNPFGTYDLMTALDHSIPDTVNTTQSATNCYFCTVAMLLRTDVKSLVARTEIMQIEGGANYAEIVELLNAAEIPYEFDGYHPIDEAAEYLAPLDDETEFMFDFSRADGSGHMIHGIKRDARITFYDAQVSREIAHEDINLYIQEQNIIIFALWIVLPKGWDEPMEID